MAKKNHERRRRLEVFFEFLIFGIALGIVEDLVAIVLATDAKISPKLFLIVLLVTIPFAALGELIVDKTNWFKWISSRK